MQPRLIADDTLTLRAATLAGNGIAMLPRYVAGDAIRDGRLVALLPEYPLRRSWFRAHVTQNRAHQARIVRLLEWLKSALETALPPLQHEAAGATTS